jgi:hypothetical protein
VREYLVEGNNILYDCSVQIRLLATRVPGRGGERSNRTKPLRGIALLI